MPAMHPHPPLPRPPPPTCLPTRLQLSLAIDFLTWTLLVPMLMGASQDPARRQFWRQRLYCFESYNVSAQQPAHVHNASRHGTAWHGMTCIA